MSRTTLETNFTREFYQALEEIKLAFSSCKTSSRNPVGENLITNEIVGFYCLPNGLHFEVSTSIFMSGRVVGMTCINEDGSIDTDNSKLFFKMEELEDYINQKTN